MTKLGKVIWSSAAAGVVLTTVGAIIVRHRKAEEETPVVEEIVEVGEAPLDTETAPTPIKAVRNTRDTNPKMQEPQKAKAGESKTA